MTEFDLEMEAYIAILKESHPNVYELLQHTVSEFERYCKERSISDYRQFDVCRDRFATAFSAIEIGNKDFNSLTMGYRLSLYAVNSRGFQTKDPFDSTFPSEHIF